MKPKQFCAYVNKIVHGKWVQGYLLASGGVSPSRSPAIVFPSVETVNAHLESQGIRVDTSVAWDATGYAAEFY